MQTETECGNGSNNWAAARHTWDLIKHYFENGASAYMYWNMVLDETGSSRWGWLRVAPERDDHDRPGDTCRAL